MIPANERIPFAYRNRVLEAESLVARHEAEINDEKSLEKSHRLELQARFTELEGLHAKDQAEIRDLKECYCFW